MQGPSDANDARSEEKKISTDKKEQNPTNARVGDLAGGWTLYQRPKGCRKSLISKNSSKYTPLIAEP